jgi:hypothetical protein
VCGIIGVDIDERKAIVDYYICFVYLLKGSSNKENRRNETKRQKI